MAEFRVGQEIEYDVYTPGNLAVPRHEVSTINALHRGGFHGKFLGLEGRPYGAKTTIPTPLHEALRLLAWGGREFPSQVQEEALQLDFLATNLIADPLPIISNHQFIAPHSFGYVMDLGGENGLLIEELRGRGPRFKPENEFEKFRATQRRLANIAFYLGLEQVGQIHPDNPFGFDNLWYSDEKSCFIWLDTLAAFKHQPLFGIFPFAFHKDIHDHFYPGDPRRITFNTIHLDTYLKRIALYKDQFDPETYERIQENAKMYEKISESETLVETARNFMPLLTDVKGILQEVPEKLAGLGGILDLAASVFSSKARRRLVFQGAEKAEELGILASDDLNQAKADFEVHQEMKHGSIRFKAAEVLMAAYYLGSKLTIDSIQWTAGIANTLSDNELWLKILTLPLIAIAGQIPSSTSRILGTLGVGLLTRTDLRTAASVAWIPGAGNVLPFSAQAVVNSGSDNYLLWHYSVRDYLAKFSRLSHIPSSFFAGGWGTQYEGELYNLKVPFMKKTIGSLLEGLAVKT